MPPFPSPLTAPPAPLPPVRVSLIADSSFASTKIGVSAAPAAAAAGDLRKDVLGDAHRPC